MQVAYIGGSILFVHCSLCGCSKAEQLISDVIILSEPETPESDQGDLETGSAMESTDNAPEGSEVLQGFFRTNEDFRGKVQDTRVAKELANVCSPHPHKLVNQQNTGTRSNFSTRNCNA